MVPAAVLTQSKPVFITVVRPVSAAMLKLKATRPRHAKPFVTKSNSPTRRHLTRSLSPTVSNSPPRVTAVKAAVGNLRHALKDKGVIDSGCSRQMTRNMSYLFDFEELNGGYVAFEVVIDDYSRFTWVFFLATMDETSPILKTFFTGLENQLSLKVKVIRSDNGTEFKNNDLNQFFEITSKFSVMDYFKGMSYDGIRPIFEAKFNSNMAFLLKTKEQIEEDENRALKRLNETPAEKAAKRKKLNDEVEELKRHLQIVPNEDDDVYTEATPLLEREDLKALWSLVKERFSTTKPKNFSDDFLLVKGWKLLESCGMQIITFTSTQLILLVERKYPLIRFTLDQMLNAIILEVEEESEVSLELLSFGVDVVVDLKKNMLSV
uniref:Putative ribonuclease H-like domain-containing protein n=1 Tax=Tanacetum cinerariifolium TaxID=118510 RepID=A0A6L2LEY5_TANCI|nr:putative ribonuclease H-like domain-containing protein [Tanacetum cinerariifolium]